LFDDDLRQKVRSARFSSETMGHRKAAMDLEAMPEDNSPPGTMPTNTKTGSRGERLLGGYLFALCIYQVGIYFWPGGPPFILDPRAGIPVLLINHFSFDNKVIYPVEWITATWLVIAAVTIFSRGKLLRTYLTTEILLAAPTAYYICVLAIRHGGDFAPAFKDLVLTLLLFLVFSVIPCGMAIQRILSRRKMSS
jgi:hypothetical protein